MGQIQSDSMNLDVFMELTSRAGMDIGDDASIIVALYIQASIETGNFKSRLYSEDNNMFGMRPAIKRERFYDSIVNRGNGDFCKYADLSYSLRDRLNWDEYNKIAPPISGYLPDQLAYLDKCFEKGYLGLTPNPKEVSDYRQAFIDRYNRLVTDGGDIDTMMGDGLHTSGGSAGNDGLFNLDGIFNWKLFSIPIIFVALLGFFLYKKFKK